MTGKDADRLGAAAPVPRRCLSIEIHLHVLWHDVNVGVLLVRGVTVLVNCHRIAQKLHGIREAMVGVDDSGIGVEVATKTVRLEGKGTAGVLLLGQTEHVRAKTDLGLDFLLTVAKVVVGKDGYHNTPLVTEGNLERTALVVELKLISPAHARGLLCLGGLANVRQAQILLTEGAKMRSKNDAAGRTGPVVNVKGRIILGKMRITGIAKD
mmetsp:Transcript_31385/g.69574  ORF Transcript_31385/g.69574 Transcript_31385/m.69574 type:complete len:210 (-) Transcript_31385:857-1486(-)